MGKRLPFFLTLTFGLLFAFQNCSDFNEVSLEQSVGSEDLVTSSRYRFANNRQDSFVNTVFGTSPYAVDSRSLYDTNSNGGLTNNQFWDKMAQKMDSLILHTLMLDDVGEFQDAHPTRVALNDSQLDGVEVLQDEKDFKILVDVGFSLGRHCDIRNTGRLVAAAVAQEMQVLSRLHENGRTITIDEISIDGPFSRLIQGSVKRLSCQTKEPSRPFNQAQTVEIVRRYILLLRRAIYDQQGSWPEVNIVLNLPNWKVGNLASENGSQLDIISLLRAFANTNLGTSGINEIVLDYPYSFIEGKPGKFQTRITRLYDVLSSIPGSPSLSFIINTNAWVATSNRSSYRNGGANCSQGKACLLYSFGIADPDLRFWVRNQCLRGAKDNQFPNAKTQANRIVAEEGYRYTRHSHHYYNMVKQGLPTGIEVNSIYLQTWHHFPRSMRNYGLRTIGFLPDL